MNTKLKAPITNMDVYENQTNTGAHNPSQTNSRIRCPPRNHRNINQSITVAASGKANNPLTVTLTNDASMGLSAPLACANTFFSMPSLTGITATGGGTGTATTSPATDGWTS